MLLSINKKIDVSVLVKMMTELSVDIEHVMQFEKLLNRSKNILTIYPLYPI